jgi:hypothetical protein
MSLASEERHFAIEAAVRLVYRLRISMIFNHHRVCSFCGLGLGFVGGSRRRTVTGWTPFAALGISGEGSTGRRAGKDVAIERSFRATTRTQHIEPP